MFDKLDALEERYQRLEQAISDHEVIQKQQDKWREMAKEHAVLSETVSVYRDYKEKRTQLKGVKEILAEKGDPEMLDLAREEAEELQGEIEKLEQRKVV